MKLREYCYNTLLKAYENVCKSQADSGKFVNPDGTYTVYQQYAGFYFAWLYTENFSGNPYYMDPKTLERAIAGWDYFCSTLDEDGRTHIVTANQDWGYHADEWGLYYWINTLDLLKPYLDAEKIDHWNSSIAKAVLSLREAIDRERNSEKFREDLFKYHTVRNHFAWYVLCYYRYGMLYNRPDMMDYAAKIMDEILDSQSPEGTWLEARTPVVHYADVTACAISIYALLSKNPKADRAVEKCLDYAINTLYPDFTNIEVLDGRNKYSDRISAHTAPTYSRSEKGTIYLSNWIKHFNESENFGVNRQGLVVITDIVRYLEEDAEFMPERLPEIMPPVTFYPRIKTKVLRSGSWCVPFCCFEQTTVDNRWYLHRAVLFSVFHTKTGLLLGGGNSISQPQVATFNVITKGLSRYIPDRGELIENGDGVNVYYGDRKCTVKLVRMDSRSVKFSFSAEGLTETERVYVNIPVCVKPGDDMQVGNSKVEFKEHYFMVEIPEAQEIIFKSARIAFTEHAVLSYPVFRYSPYRKKQARNYSEATGIITLELDYLAPGFEMEITI